MYTEKNVIEGSEFNSFYTKSVLTYRRAASGRASASRCPASLEGQGTGTAASSATW